MNFYKMERVALLIDGLDTHHAVITLGFSVDYKRLLALSRSRCVLVRAYYFTAINEHPDREITIRPLLDWLEYNGFTVITKPVKIRTDIDGQREFDRSMDIELAVCALQLAHHIDHAVIFSGDGAIKPLVVALQEIGKRVTIVSTRHTKPVMIADELRRLADQVVDWAELRPEVALDQHRQAQQP